MKHLEARYLAGAVIYPLMIVAHELGHAASCSASAPVL
jgi:hypothetical protein